MSAAAGEAPAPAPVLAVRLCQCAAGSEPAANRDHLRELLLRSPQQPAALTLLPENALCFGAEADIRRAARPAAEWAAFLAPLAQVAGGVLVAGGVPVPAAVVADSATAGRLCQAALAVAPDGTLLARYDKAHLFRLDPDQAGGSDESRLYRPGDRPGGVFTLHGWRIGLAICFDLRFPELFRALQPPADLWLCPAAFARETGHAHWRPLLQARAIENQCYVAAAGLCGTNPETGFACFGHSLLLDPWGEAVLAAPGAAEGCFGATLERARLAAVRRRLPALAARRFG
ncbi:MAG: nitrilase-related carbon-nitrogen hydrolase [Lentisphaeria bacterium]|jgi:nitrilase